MKVTKVTKVMKSVFSGKKLLSLVLVLCFASGAFASQTRIAGLGISNWMIEDDFNIWLNPAQINNYKGIAYGEFGTIGVPILSGAGDGIVPNAPARIANQWAGVNLGSGLGTIGLYLQRPYAGALSLDVDGNGIFDSTEDMGDVDRLAIPVGGILGIDDAVIPVNSGIPLVPNTHKFDLIYGLALSDSMSFGARFSYASISVNSNYEVDAAPAPAVDDGAIDNQTNSSQIDIVLGALLRDIAIFNSLDATLTISMPRIEVSHSENSFQGAGELGLTADYKVESDNAMNLGFLVRGINSIGGESSLITTFQYQGLDNSEIFSLVTQQDDTVGLEFNQTDTRTNKQTTIRLDGAINTKAGKDILVVVSAGIASISGELSATSAMGPNNAWGVPQTTTNTLEEDGIKVSRFQIPLVVAVEHKTSEVLTSRVGITRPILQSIDTTSTDRDFALATGAITNEREIKTILDADLPLGFSAGIGLNVLKDLVIDATISQQILFDGPHFVSGVPNSVFGQLTASYRF